MDNVEIYGEFINNTVDLTSYSYGGAISFKDAVSNSIINATFADNSANKFGGAIYFDANKNVNNIKIYGEFNNNKANSEGRGGAISFREDVSNSIINALFINNAVVGSNIFGGAIYFQAPINNLDITGKFINNTGKDVIYIGSAGSGNEIHDAVFLNNAANNIINIGSGSVYASDNWFGNNATNYNETPANVGIDLDNWLFLNATANPSELELNKSSTVAFKLYNKNSPAVEYDASKMNIVLDLAQTLGELDKDTALIGEEISYTSKDVGTAGVTGKFETASYTVSLKNVILTNITLENTTFNLKVNDEVSSGATLTPADAGNLTYTSSNSSVAIVENGKIKAISEGNAIITVSFAGNEQYKAAENKTIAVTVTLRDAKWTYIGFSGVEEDLDGASLYLPLNYIPDCFVRDADGIGLPAGTDITIFCEGNNNYTITTTTQEGGLFNVDVSGVEPYQVYMVSFSTEGYTSAIASVYVIKAPTEIIVANATVELKVKDEVATGASLDPSEAGNLSYTSSDSGVAIVEDGKIVGVGEGSAVITVSFAGNDVYAAAQNRTIDVTVSLRDAKWTYIGFSGIEEDFDGASLYLPLNYAPDCFVRDADGIGLPAGTDITIFCEGNNNYTITTTTQEGGLFNVDVSGVEPYQVYMVSFSTEGYTSAIASVYVIKAPTEIIVANATVDMKVKDEIATGATLNPSDAGNLTYTSSDSGVAIVEDGKIVAVGEGSAIITVSFAGNDIYAAAQNRTIDVIVSVGMKNTTLTVPNVEATYGDGSKLVATLTDEDGNPVGDAKIKFAVSGGAVKYICTDTDGKAALDMSNYGIGKYWITATFVATDLYEKSTAKAKFIISPKKETAFVVSDFETAYNSGDNLTATLVDEYGDAIVGAKVIVDFNGDILTLVTDYDGQVFVSIMSVVPGNYTVDFTYAGDTVYDGVNASVNVFVDKMNTTLDVPNVYSIYGDGSKLVATLTDANGNPVAGAKIKFAVSGGAVKYIRTDVNGQAALGMSNYGIGNYWVSVTFVATDMYEKSAANAKFIISPKKETAFVVSDFETAYNSGDNLTATLVDEYGDAIVGAEVIVELNGDASTLITGDNGQVFVATAGLVPGNYTVDFTYGGDTVYNGANASVNVFVDKMNTTLTAPFVNVTYGGDAKLVATLTDANGNAIGDAKIKFAVSGKAAKYVRTDADGKATLDISKYDVGSYWVTVTFVETDLYSSAVTNAKVFINEPENSTGS